MHLIRQIFNMSVVHPSSVLFSQVSLAIYLSFILFCNLSFLFFPYENNERFCFYYKTVKEHRFGVQNNFKLRLCWYMYQEIILIKHFHSAEWNKHKNTELSWHFCVSLNLGVHPHICAYLIQANNIFFEVTNVVWSSQDNPETAPFFSFLN